MKYEFFLLLVILFYSQITFAQSIQSITDKISDKICDCMSEDMKSYDDIKPEFNRCYDLEFNQIFSVVDASEQKILVQSGVLEKIKKAIIPNLQEKCGKIKSLAKSELEAIKKDGKFPNSAFPTNFNESHFDDLNAWNGKIVALQGDVIQIETSGNNTPYSKLKVGNQEIWVISMIDSGFEIMGAHLKIVGYLSQIKKMDYEKKFSDDAFHIIAMGIVDVESEKLAYFPGSITQMKQWINGEIPAAR